MHQFQTIAEMFRSTRGGKHRVGRCEACDEVLSVDEVNVCQDCEFNGRLEEERDN
jgi:hypothetical protein